MEDRHPLTEYLVRKFMGYPPEIRESVFSKVINSHPVIRKLSKQIRDLEDEMHREVDKMVKNYPGLDKKMSDFDKKRSDKISDLDTLDAIDKEIKKSSGKKKKDK
jgi:hypothetical protein